MTDSEELDTPSPHSPPSQVSSVRLRMPPQRTRTSLGSAHEHDEHGKQTHTLLRLLRKRRRHFISAERRPGMALRPPEPDPAEHKELNLK